MELKKRSKKAGIRSPLMQRQLEGIWKEMLDVHKEIIILREEVKRSKRHPMDMYLSKEEVMKKFNISENTLRHWRDAGHISCFNRNRKILYSWDSIETFIKGNLSKVIHYRSDR